MKMKMKMKKTYTYNDWWSGDICMNTSDAYFKPEEERLLNRVGWDEIEKDDVKKIRDKQTEIFNDEIAKRLTILTDNFLEKYKNSRMKALFLEKEINMVETVMFGQFPIKERIRIPDYELVFIDFNLDHVQKHIIRYILEGNLLSMDFVHSPNFKLIKKDVPIEVYATTLFNYHKFLESFKDKNFILNKTQLLEETQAKIHDNPFPQIFKNVYAFQFYEELVKHTVNKKTEAADFGFIYHKLQDKKIEAILPGVTHKAFIKFINNDNRFNITVTKLNPKNQNHKQATYSTLLDKFMPLISEQDPKI